MENVSKHLDILIWAFWAIWEHLPILPECQKRYCISSTSITTCKSCNHVHDFSNSHLGRKRACSARTCKGSRVVFYNVPSEHGSASLCKIWNLGSNSTFFRWRLSIKKLNGLSFLSLCASRKSSCLLMAFYTTHAEIFSTFFHSVHGNLCILNLHRLLRRKSKWQKEKTWPAVRSSWNLTVMILLAVSWIHEIPLFNQILISTLSLHLRLASLSWCWDVVSIVLHVMASAIDLPVFLLRLVKCSQYSLSSGSIK